MKKIVFYRIKASDLNCFGFEIDRRTYASATEAADVVDEIWPKFIAKLKQLEGSEILFENARVSMVLGYGWHVVRRYKSFCPIYSVYVEKGYLYLR